MTEATTTTNGVTLTAGAATKVRDLLEREGRDDLTLRIAVQPGGDVLNEWHGVNVVTDRMSSPYLGGATIDFVDTIEKQGFTIENPNAGGSCACGDSFH
jgi:Fe-S cluster assembly iron-binding protein IscA